MPLTLTPVDPAAWANATIGSTLTFRVVNDVVRKSHRSSYADAYAGDLIEAKVIRVRETKARTRHERAEPRVREVVAGKYIKLELVSAPEGHRFSGIAKNLVVWSAKGPFTAVVVALLPIWCIAVLIVCSTTECDL